MNQKENRFTNKKYFKVTAHAPSFIRDVSEIGPSVYVTTLIPNHCLTFQEINHCLFFVYCKINGLFPFGCPPKHSSCFSSTCCDVKMEGSISSGVSV